MKAQWRLREVESGSGESDTFTTGSDKPAPGPTPMQQINDGKKSYRIGDLTLDADAYEVRRNGLHIELAPLSFRMLLLLAERAPAVVSQTEIVEQIWQGRVVTPETVTQRIKLLRAALGDDARSPRYIGLVRGAGYRLVAPVTTQLATEEGDAVEARQTRRQRQFVITVAATIAIVAAVVAYLPGRLDVGPQVAPAPGNPAQPAIAVLPFMYLGDGRHSYIADGIAEELLHQLSRSRDHRVIARTSSFALRDAGLDVPGIAARLGARYLVQGSVREFDGSIRITAQLIDGIDNVQLWSKAYDREVDDVLSVQRDIAIEIGELLQLGLAASDMALMDVNPDAYRHYLRGQFFWNRRGPGDLERANSSFRQAVEIDPRLARAWTGLAASSNALFWDAGAISQSESLAVRRYALEQALALRPDSGEAHGRFGRLLWELGERQKAERQIELALDLEPDNPFLLELQANHLEWQGDLERSVALSRRAILADPLSVASRNNLGALLLYAGRSDEARMEFDEVGALSPMQDQGFEYALLEIQQSRYSEALAMAESLSLPEDRSAIRVMAFLGLGRVDDAASLIRELEASDEPRAILHLAHIRARSGDAEAPFEALQKLERVFNENPDMLREVESAVVFLMALRFAPYLRNAHSNERWTTYTSRILDRSRQPEQGITERRPP